MSKERGLGILERKGRRERERESELGELGKRVARRGKQGCLLGLKEGKVSLVVELPLVRNTRPTL